MSSILSLPLEILGMVGSHLPGQDLKNCSLACKGLDYGTRYSLFSYMEFSCTRAAMAEELLQFLAYKEKSRIQDMARACRSLRIEVQNGGTFTESSEFLPALIMSAKGRLPRVTSLSLSFSGLSRLEIAAMKRMLKRGPTWDAVKVFKPDLNPWTMRDFLKHTLPNVEGIDIALTVAQHRVSCIKETCPQLRRLRVNFKNPLWDFHNHLTANYQVKLKDLDSVEQLVIRRSPVVANEYENGAILRPIDITDRLCEIADHLGGLTALRKLSIEFHPSIMIWAYSVRRNLGPGQYHRIRLDTFVMTAIMAMGARLPQVEEICLVERSAVFDGVNMVHWGIRDHNGEMAVTIEDPGCEDNFPLNISQ